MNEMTKEEMLKEVDDLLDELKGKDNSEVDKIIDIGDFVRDLVEEWDLDQLMEYAMENLNDFYNKHKDIFEQDLKLFMEDCPDHLLHHCKTSHYVQGY